MSASIQKMLEISQAFSLFSLLRNVVESTLILVVLKAAKSSFSEKIWRGEKRRTWSFNHAFECPQHRESPSPKKNLKVHIYPTSASSAQSRGSAAYYEKCLFLCFAVPLSRKNKNKCVGNFISPHPLYFSPFLYMLFPEFCFLCVKMSWLLARELTICLNVAKSIKMGEKPCESNYIDFFPTRRKHYIFFPNFGELCHVNYVCVLTAKKCVRSEAKNKRSK